MNKKILSILAVVSLFFVCSCSNNSNSNQQQSPTNTSTETKQLKADSSNNQVDVVPNSESKGESDLNKKYICPNRCEASESAGICSACGMDYIENLDYKAE